MSNYILTTEEKFIKYHDKLRDELNKAYTHYEICKSLRDFRTSHYEEFINALTFFNFTIDANLFATVMSINRFIDKRKESLKLDIFFKFVEDNLNMFSDEAYEKRLRNKGMDDEDCGHWMKKHIKITPETIRQDRQKVENLPIHNLKIWRDKKLAHINKNFILIDIDVMQDSPVTISEIDQILDTLHEILNRYLISYNGTEWAIGLPTVKPQIEYIINSIKFFRES
jgi:hypothetical protein